MNRTEKTIRRVFPARLTEERAGWTQDELADAVGVTRGEISHLETGRRLPGVVTLVRLAHVLRVSVDRLLGLK